MSNTNIAPCPFCGCVAEHESTITQEVIRCTMCPAVMMISGSGAAVIAMWNTRVAAQAWKDVNDGQ